MRAERRSSAACARDKRLPGVPAAHVPGALAALVSCALATVLPRPLHAQGLTGYAQGQYQLFDQVVQRGDGPLERQRVERWVQTLELQHMATPRGDLRVMSSFRLTDLGYRGMPDQSHNPQGTLQISHPWASLFAAYRPSTVTGGLGPSGVAAVADTGRARTLTARSQEAIVTGQIAPPAWPRLDVAWTRHHRDRDPISAEETGVTRMARMNWSNERLNVYGSLGGEYGERAGVRTGSSQRTSSLGGALHLAPARNANVDLNYDLNDARVGDPLRTSGSSRGHSAALNAAWRPGALSSTTSSTQSSWSGSWLWRRAEARGPQGLTTEDHEGSLQYALDPPGPVRLFGAAGARTLRTNGGRAFAKNLSAVASLDGRVRTGWTGVASLTHVTNWEPGRGNWSVEMARLGSQMTLTRGLECAADAQMSTSDDTTARDVNTTSEANVRARFSPWQAFSLGLTARRTRSGAGLLGGSVSAARAAACDVRWRPVRALELTGGAAATRGSQGARTTTRSAAARWAAHARLQLSADWSRSSDQRATTGAQPINGREIASLHALAAITRKVQLDAAAGVADRGGPRENRQATVTLTWAFGR